MATLLVVIVLKGNKILARLSELAFIFENENELRHDSIYNS